MAFRVWHSGWGQVSSRVSEAELQRIAKKEDSIWDIQGVLLGRWCVTSGFSFVIAYGRPVLPSRACARGIPSESAR